jgi:hypothetical protein
LMMMTTTTKTAGPYTPTKQDIQRIDKRTDWRFRATCQIGEFFEIFDSQKS